MAVRIRTSDGSAYLVDGPFEELQQKVVDALAQDRPFIEVKNGNGQLRSLNPRLITSLEEIGDDSLSPQEEEILESAREAQAPTQPR